MTNITVDEAVRIIGTLPSLAPHPNATNIRALEVAFFDALEGIPSQQSPEFGYKGMSQQAAEYALNVNVPWIDFPDPGNHRQADGTMNTQQHRDADAIFAAMLKCRTNQQCVKRASMQAPT